ncbi:MAG: hypothetical protein ACK4MH_06545 [Brevundimonas sp.]|uniref:hypothetical protein n=1 Tax=Brevundimonas sp. TaxID=1871086 RepID=UPI00391A746F
MKAAVQRAAPGVTDAQASDIARRVIAADQPEITSEAEVRLASGETMADALGRHAQAAPHLFSPPETTVHATSDAARAKLKAMKAADRLEAANAAVGVTGAWVREFRKGRVQ